jgi:hypothetical protein
MENEQTRSKGVSADRVRAALSGIPAAKVLEFSEEGGKLIVRISPDLFVSNEDFERIHGRMVELGGRYLKGEKAWEF